MTRPRVLILFTIFALFGILFATMATAGNDNILNTDTAGTDLVMNDLALRDTVSYTGDPSDWTIYMHSGIRFGTDDRVIGFYDVMVPVYLSDNSILFVNPRFSHDSDDGHEWNLGGGYRQILWDNQLMLGLNAYYDLKKHGDSGKYFDQWGMGFEAMGEFDNVMAAGGGLGLTGRFNFYVPLEGSKSAGGTGTGGGYIFSSLGIFNSGGGGAIYEPLTGLDYEMGMRIPYLSEYVETWAYAGGYHYWGRESGHLDGFSGRIEVIPADFLALDFEYRNDNRYGNELYGEVKVEVPFSIGNLVRGENPFEGLGSRFGGSRDLHERMVEPVRRDIDIKIETVTTGDGSSTGGLIEQIIFVSEGAAAGTGDGSFENPYASIDEALLDPRLGATAFTIHVMNDNGGDGVAGGGDFTTVGAIANLLIWGSGAAHPVYGTPANMLTGFPEISSTLAVDDDAAEIMGLYFNNAGGTGLVASGGSGMLIHSNRFTANGTYGLELLNFNNTSVYANTFNGTDYGLWLNGGTGADIYNNTFTGTRGIEGTDGTDVLISSNTFDVDNCGIRFSYGSNNIDGLEITGNSITVNGTGNIYGIDLYANSSSIDAVITNNTFGSITSTNDSAYGISLLSYSSSIDAIITNNTFDDITGTGDDAYGITLSAGDYIDADITNNTFDDIAGTGDNAYGMFFQSYSELDAEITGNTFNSITGMDIAHWMNLRASDYILADIANNTITGSIEGGGYGIGISLQAGDYLEATITGNTLGSITGTSDDAYGMYLRASDYIDASIENNTFTGSIYGGYSATGLVLLGNSNYIDASITNNTFSTIHASSDIAMGININNSSNYIDAYIANNTFSLIHSTGYTAFGMYLYSGTSDIYAGIIGNTFDVTSNSSAAFGAYLEAGGLIGDVTGTYTYFQNNSGTIDGASSRYMLYLDTGNPGGGNYVDWSGNTFTPLNGGAASSWSGNYDAGDSLPASGTGPVETNFTNTGTGDTLTP